jgi:bisanhydrobacterioruberin hydratase
MHKNKLKHLSRERITIFFLIIFYMVGVAGMSIPASSDFFILLTPYALILNMFLLAINHHSKFSIKHLSAFIFIYVASLAVEIAGVQSGIIFGSYTYGSGLGIKLFDTPLLIGLNWVFLIYASSTLVQQWKLPAVTRVLAASVIMVLYDLVLEHVAPKIDMWSWEGNQIPIQNYVAWFVLSLIFHSVLEIFKIRNKNKLAAPVLLIQFAFFIVFCCF